MRLLKTIIFTALITVLVVCGFIYRSAIPHLTVWAQSDIEMSLDDFKAADNGDPTALYKLGDLYFSTQDYKTAANYYKQASDKDFSPAMIKLSKMYKEGIGVPQDRAKANELLVRASTKGNIDALKSLGNEVQDAFESFMGR